MKKDNKQYNNINIPNTLSILRLILSISLYFIWGNSFFLLIVILIIGITDIFDGYIAKKYNQNTKFGAWLDSMADFVFFISFVLCVIIYELNMIMDYEIFIIAIMIIKLFSIIICWFKYKKFGFLHTLGNKITGIILFIGMCLFIINKTTIIIVIGLCVSIIFSLEEMIINIIGKDYKENIKGIFEVEIKM